MPRDNDLLNLRPNSQHHRWLALRTGLPEPRRPGRNSKPRPRTGIIAAVLGAALGCAGCQAHTGASTVAAPGQPAAQTQAGPSPAAGEHKESIFATFVLRLRDGQTGAPLAAEAFTERLRAAQVVYVGERHNSRSSHAAQLRVLEQVYALAKEIAVGIEMLPRTLQPQLDSYLAGRIDTADFLAAVDWDNTWGFDFALYQPLFEFCKNHGVPMYALNAPRDLAKAVRQRGVAGLTASERSALPSGYPWPAPEAHRIAIEHVFARHSFGDEAKRTPEERRAAFDRFYAAQLVWDESMAQGVVELLGRAQTPPRRVVVLAGTGHVGRFAIPARAARRGVKAGLAIGPVDEASEDPPSESGANAADAVDVQVVLPAPAVR